MVKRIGLTFLFFSAVTFSAAAKVYELNIYKFVNAKPQEPSDYLIYKVKRGDTLLKILKKFHIPPYKLKEIVKLNKLKNPNLIYAGSKLKLPVSFSEIAVKGKGKEKEATSPYLEGMKLLGAKVERQGALFLENEKINFSKYPKVSFNGNQFIVDLNNSLKGSVKKEIESLGISVVNGTQLENLFENSLSSAFGSVQKNGNLTLGINDVLVYHYDYMGYDSSTGERTVVNLKSDTPAPLKKLLFSYGVRVVQPQRKCKTDLTAGEGEGELKILSGNGREKLAELVYLVSKHKGKVTEKGVVIPDCKIYAVLDTVSPQEKVQLELEGYKVFTLTGNFADDAEKLLELIPIATKKVKLILKEPPSSGKRSTFYIKGIQIFAPQKEWFMVDSFDKLEEIPYLRYRGVNLIVY
ncbi:LysM domain-containing protein [Desulfurobacterium pacificum]|uniref:LysM domain-containing protein n=1 Tax=Desulfurobacterium pacificum TaxID=240166 RepID=A0ABY1NJJ8_9BACT|nr:LysM domain-containing protein [Desulfurobacterium pacificum]SMP11494.1 LysM domain-containing protein [Desulfurobacterium pacificum]